MDYDKDCRHEHYYYYSYVWDCNSKKLKKKYIGKQLPLPSVNISQSVISVYIRSSSFKHSGKIDYLGPPYSLEHLSNRSLIYRDSLCNIIQQSCINTLHGITMLATPYVKSEDKLLYRA
jgi:hypothetical protein